MSKQVTSNGKPGGLLKGKTHSQGGIKAVVVDTNEPVELETDEVIITANAVKDKKVRVLKGTNAEILSEINQSGGGVPIPSPNEFKYGGPVVQFNRNHVPNKSAMNLAARIKSDMPEVWHNHGTSFENNLHQILTVVFKRGHWLPTEKDHYKIWQMYCFNNKSNETIDGIVGMIKCGCLTKSGFAHMKNIIEQLHKGANEELKEHKKTFSKQKNNPSITAKQAGEMVAADHVEKNDDYYTKIESAKLETGGVVGTRAEYDKAVSDLNKAETMQKMMKTANAILRSKKDVTNRLIKEAGFSEKNALALQEPDRYGRVGFPSYSLTNNNASIKRLQDRVNMLSKKLEGAAQAEKSGESESYEFEGGSIELNYSIDRVQILFDSIPSSEIRTKLKGNGWNWSPSNKAWQRKITPQAISNAVYMFSAKKRGSGSTQEIETVPPSVASGDYERMLETRNFSFVSVYFYKGLPQNGNYDGDTTFRMVYFDLVKPTVVEGVKSYLTKHLPDLDVEKITVNVYPKTYVKDAKILFAAGRYLPSDVSPEILLGKAYKDLVAYFAKKSDYPNIIESLKPEFSKAIEDLGITQAYFVNDELNLVSNYEVMPDLVAAMENYLRPSKKTEPFDDTIIEPNTSSEFDDAVITSIEPFEGWQTDEVKQRDIKSQIYQAISGPEQERHSETERLFKKFVERNTFVPESVIKPNPILEPTPEPIPVKQFLGIDYDYPNQYALNKAIEQFISEKTTLYTSEEKNFIRKYSGYGGLDKYGKTAKGGLFEFYTPKEIIEKMWALAYKFGYNDGPVLEPSVGTGEFLQFAPDNAKIVGYEINEYSAKICQVLYPNSEVILQPFEKVFIRNNYTVKDKTEDLAKFDLVIGNPPYGDFSVVESRYMSGMGEKDHTKARNYVEYFLRRSIDLLNPGGLLIFIIGAQLKNGGTMFLDSGDTPVKKYLSENCQIIDAYRLPDSVFERTSVTADIIVLQKNKP